MSLELAMYKEYVKSGTQWIRPYIEGEDMSGVSIEKGATARKGWMIAIDKDNLSDKWAISPEYFAANYEPKNK